MRLSELMSNLSPGQLTEIALVLFLAVFVAVSVRVFARARADHERAAGLPFDDGTSDHHAGGAR